jgi:rapamycin-insensitive companion of mTOR
LFIICSAALKNTPLTSFAGGIQAIVRNVLDCEMPRLNESLMVTLLYLLNNAQTRQFVRLDVGLEVCITYINKVRVIFILFKLNNYDI